MKLILKIIKWLIPNINIQFNTCYNCNIDLHFVKLYKPYFLSDVSIGNYTYISQNSNISHTKIGKYCSIGPNLLCGWGIHPLNGISTSPMFYSNSKVNGFDFSEKNTFQERKTITIGNDVFIGANVTILDGVTIGDGAVIGAGAVVSKNIPPYAIAIGIPIHVVRYRFTEEKITKLVKIKWWEHTNLDHCILSHSFYNVDEIINKL